MIRVLLVDDQELVRSGFRIILESEPDIEVVGEAATGVEAVQLAAAVSPDVICMDVEMPEMNGIEASRRILAAATSAGEPSAAAPAVLILTTFGHDAYLFDALAAGVSGFLLKASRAEQLIEAVRALAAGQALLGPDVTRAVMERAANPQAAPPRPAATAAQLTAGAPSEVPTQSSAARIAAHAPEFGLTERESEVLSLIAEGRSNGEIAETLFLGEATVKTHVSNLLQKMGARDRIQLIVWSHTGGAAPAS